MMTERKILIISRKYPPSVGGMQAYAKNFIRHMERIYHVDKILLKGGQANLIWFLPYAFVKAIVLMLKNSYDVVYLCDGLLAPVGVMLKKIFRAKTAVTVHGLDVTYNGFLYQRVVPEAIKALDKVVCVSGNTMTECVKRGIKKEKCVVITNGIEPDEYNLETPPEECGRKLAGSLGGGLDGKKILVTVGRLIKRKGIDWFMANVMPRLGDEFVYLVAGDGPEDRHIMKVRNECGLGDRVRLLGRVSHETLKLLYNSAHAMVLPNQKIKHDPEGFGIVALEAASCGLPVIAGSVDGVSEAVLNGKTGWLIEDNDAGMFAEKIKVPGLIPRGIKKASEIFSWDNIIRQYQREIDAL